MSVLIPLELREAWTLDAECLVYESIREQPQIFVDLQAATGSELAIQKQLRGRYSDSAVRTALSLAELRRRAAVKFTRANELWFDRQGLEQATAEPVARHKALRFTDSVRDLCCGIGGDALALSARVPVVAVDCSPIQLWRTAANAEVYGVEHSLEVTPSDVESQLSACSGLIHIDPDRRPGGAGRVSRVEDYVPGLDVLESLIATARGGAIKLGPASNFGGKFTGGEFELISLHGECKEATFWFGELAGPTPFRATVLPSGETIAGHPLDAVAEIGPLQEYLYDPDPAVVRAGLVDLLAVQLSLSRLDAAEEYLTGSSLVTSPFVRAFRVIEELPNNDRLVRQAVHRQAWGQVEIKCRHIRIDADAIRRSLPLEGDQPGVLFWARLNGKARVILAERSLSPEA